MCIRDSPAWVCGLKRRLIEIFTDKGESHPAWVDVYKRQSCLCILSARPFFYSWGYAERFFMGSVSYTHLDVYKRQEVEEQVDLMYSLIHQQVDAIVLVPIDSKALVQPVVEAEMCIRDSENCFH